MNIVALLSVYNEEPYLARCLRHLHEQGIGAYVIDNGSTDRSPAIIRSFLNRGVVGTEVQPRAGIFELESLLRREEELAAELGADWYMHHDADEIREAPSPYRTLREGIQAADAAGYNAVNFDEFVFTPTGSDENYEHDRFPEEMEWYYFFRPRRHYRLNAWKNFGQRVDLRSSGGHCVKFEGQRVYPQDFILRHYMMLSRAHAIRKYCGRVYSEAERMERNWHNARAGLQPDQIHFPPKSRLRRISHDRVWDRSDPWTRHPVFEQARPSAKRSRATTRASMGRALPPAPFIVGNGRSGTTLLRLMLDSHPDLAIPPETHFVPSMIKEFQGKWILWQPEAWFFKTLTGHRRWADFCLDPGALRSSIRSIKRFDLAEGFRAFYRLYAEQQGKSRWGDKTPTYVASMEAIQDYLPEVRFIHLIRDGRDVALSFQGLWFGPKSIEQAASQWVTTIREARRQAQHLQHYVEIKYEDLIARTPDTLRRICEFIELPWNASMLNYHERAGERLKELQRDIVAPAGERVVRGEERTAIHRLTASQPDESRINRWKTEMGSADQTSFEAIARTMLRELGYDVE
ncbi:MAG: sulfotransferase [Nitrospirota bacterium]